MVKPVRLVIINDFEMVVQGIETMLRPFADRVQVTETVSGAAPRASSDVALFDDFGSSAATAASPGYGGILQDHRAVRLVVYTWRTEAALIAMHLYGGASALVSKAVAPEALVGALEEVYAGVPLTEPGTWSSTGESPGWPGRDRDLTERQAELLALIAQGLDDQQIADRAFLPVATVASYVRSTCLQIGVANRSEAERWAVDQGFRAGPRRG